jgi:phage baseplate assembly protein W
MKVTVRKEDLEDIVLVPESTAQEVAQNINALANTPRGSVPLMGGLGMEMDYLDKPMAVAAAMFEQELVEKLSEYEERATILGAVNFTDEQTGVLTPEMEVRIDG